MAVTNTILTPTVISKTALLSLEDNNVMVGLVHQDYSNEFNKIGATVIVRKPSEFTATTVSGTVNTGTVSESSVAVVLDSHIDISVELDSQELTLNVVDFSEQVTIPAMQAVADYCDNMLTAKYIDVPGHYPVSATPAVSDIAGLESVLDVQKVPMNQDRYLVLHPITKADYMSLDAFLHASKRGDGGKAMKRAELGEVLGFQTYMDQNIKSHTGGDMDDVTGALKGSLAATKGTATVDAITSGGTVLAGDVFKFQGVDEWFTVLANATASASTLTVTYSASSRDGTNVNPVADNTVVTFQKTHRANLAFAKTAFAFVNRPLVPPLGGAKYAQANYNGLSIRVVYDYELRGKENLISFDMLCGAKTLEGRRAARLVDAR